MTLENEADAKSAIEHETARSEISFSTRHRIYFKVKCPNILRMGQLFFFSFKSLFINIVNYVMNNKTRLVNYPLNVNFMSTSPVTSFLH